MLKKIVLVALALLPVSSVSFAAQSALATTSTQDGGTVESTPSVSWTESNKK